MERSGNPWVTCKMDCAPAGAREIALLSTKGHLLSLVESGTSFDRVLTIALLRLTPVGFGNGLPWRFRSSLLLRELTMAAGEFYGGRGVLCQDGSWRAKRLVTGRTKALCNQIRVE